jgi:hypothetical protein
MTKRTKKNQGTKPVLALLLVGVVGAVALAAYVKYTDANHVPDDLRRPEQASKIKEGTNPATAQKHVNVLTPELKGTDLELKGQRTEVPTGQDPMVFAVNEYLKNSHITPEGARAVGVQVKDGVAYLDFSREFKQSYGSLDERNLLQGICTTLGQFSSVQKVQFQVDGQPLETLGSVELTDPIDVIHAGKPSGDQANATTGNGGL